jgi:hypothetical protein
MTRDEERDLAAEARRIATKRRIGHGAEYRAAVHVFVPHATRVEPRFTPDGVSNPRMGGCGVCRQPSVSCKQGE